MELYMKRFRLYAVMSAVCLSLLFVGCASSRAVERLNPDENIDLSGYWNDTDIRQVANALIADCLSSDWITSYRIKNEGKLPTVIVGRILNRSSEHIDTTIISKKIEIALVGSGKVNTVADYEMRDDVRDEKMDQQYNASPDTAAALGEEQGADYMLQGAVKFNLDRVGGKQVRTYYVDLELVDIESGRKVWLGEDTIKKQVTQPAYKF
jgi:uncharacterized protein (TIGR02722 family)